MGQIVGNRLRSLLGRGESLACMSRHKADNARDACRLHLWSDINERERCKAERAQFALRENARQAPKRGADERRPSSLCACDGHKIARKISDVICAILSPSAIAMSAQVYCN